MSINDKIRRLEDEVQFYEVKLKHDSYAGIVSPNIKALLKDKHDELLKAYDERNGMSKWQRIKNWFAL